jgi:hypothetical protein
MNPFGIPLKLLMAMSLSLFAMTSGAVAQSEEIINAGRPNGGLQAVEPVSGKAGELETVERSSLKAQNQPVLHPAVSSMRIVAVPVLVSGKPAWVTILDSRDRPVSGVSLLVNGQVQDSDQYGVVAFRVPNSAALSLVLQDADKKDVDRRDYSLAPSGLLLTSDSAVQVKALLTGPSPFLQSPSILYAPAVVEPGERLVVLGSNIGASENSKFMLDGVPVPLLSSSPAAAVGQVPTHIGAGPIKQLYLSNFDGVPSNSVEVDVARSEVTIEKSDTGASERDARISAYGTNLPALVRVIDEQPSIASLVLTDGTILGERAYVLVPGGEQNALPAKLRLLQSGEPQFKSALQVDSPQFLPSGNAVGQPPLRIPDAVWRSLYEAQLIKLKRRLVSVQNRINESREELEKISAEPARKPTDVDRLMSAIKALAIRQDAISVALNARHRLFEALGGTELQFQKAMDDATNGAYYVVEAKSRGVEIVPSNPIVANTAPIMSKPLFTNRRQLRALAEPKIRLLLPLEDGESASAWHAPLPGGIPEPDANRTNTPSRSVLDEPEIPHLPHATTAPLLKPSTPVSVSKPVAKAATQDESTKKAKLEKKSLHDTRDSKVKSKRGKRGGKQTEVLPEPTRTRGGKLRRRRSREPEVVSAQATRTSHRHKRRPR